MPGSRNSWARQIFAVYLKEFVRVSFTRTRCFLPNYLENQKNMKFGLAHCFVLLVLLAVSFSASRSYAQARPSPATQVLSVDFVPLAIGYPLSFQYEYKADPVTSWLLRLHYWPGLAASWSGFGFGAAYRFYIADSRALTALSVAPAADLFLFHQSELENNSGTRSAIAVAIGGDLAYKWIFDQFAVEPIVGLRYGIGPSQTPAAVATIYPIIGCSLGSAW
jgi:hypothetical protein